MDLLGRARTFVRIVDSGSLSAAARTLQRSLAAVSRQIASLEAELGVTLLVRTTRSYRMTEAGERFYEHARRLVRDADAALASVRRGGDVSGDITLSCSVSLGLMRVIPSLPALLAEHPDLRIELRLEERAVDLVGEGVDVALRAGLGLPDSTGVVAAPIATFRRLIVGAPSFLRTHGVPKNTDALRNVAAVTGLRSRATFDFLGHDGATLSIPVDTKARVGTLVGIRDAVIAGLGLAILPEFVVAGAIAARTLRRVLPNALLATVGVHALHRVEHRGSARIAALIKHLRRAIPL